MSKVVCLLGSPRPGGNSDQLASRFCETAEGNGAERPPEEAMRPKSRSKGTHVATSTANHPRR